MQDGVNLPEEHRIVDNIVKECCVAADDAQNFDEQAATLESASFTLPDGKKIELTGK